MMKRNYGWTPDVPDARDHRYCAITGRAARQLPKAVDLRPQCSAVEDQGSLGSCTANALAGALEYLAIKHGLPSADLSRLFIYYNERALEGTVLFDSGAMIRDGIKTLARRGVCTEALWPYKISRFRLKPTRACYKEALGYQIIEYQRLDTVDQMRGCLADGYPFVFGFTVYDSFETDEVAKTGQGQMPAAGDRVMGGHAVLAVGYDDEARRFLVRNSWGTGWGMQGYFTLPYDYLASRDLSDDFWTIRTGEQM